MNRTETPLLAVTLAVVLLQGAVPAAAAPAGKGGRLPVRYTKALGPAEALGRAWDFAGAAEALAKLKFREKDLAERLATRRDEIDRLARLKGRIIERLGTARPWLEKRSVTVRTPSGFKIETVGTRIVKADDRSLTVQVTGKGQNKTERRTWKSLASAEVKQLVQSAVNRKSADDQLAAGILMLACNDLTTAEKYIEKARSRGAKVDRYLGPFAAAAFARAEELIGKKKFTEALAALTEIESKYGKAPWMESHRQQFEAARTRAEGEIVKARAEKLYVEAVQFFKDKMLWELKGHLDELKKPEYAQTPPLTDAERKASLAEMAEAVKDLGKFITVRQDGKGHFKVIQAAIDTAPPKSLIEIQDDKHYNEKLVIPKEKEGLTLRGKKGVWPVITSAPGKKRIDVLLTIEAKGTTVAQVVLAHSAPAGQPLHCVLVAERARCSLRSTIVYMRGNEGICAYGKTQTQVLIENSFIVANGNLQARTAMRNCIWLASNVSAYLVDAKNSVLAVSNLVFHGASSVEYCTVPGPLGLAGSGHVVVDTVAAQVSSSYEANRIEHCNVFGTPPFPGKKNKAKPGKGCFSKPPQFVNPKNLDFRLKRTSPGRGKASGGGDMGCRYTPEMLQMLKRAFELRKKGIIKF